MSSQTKFVCDEKKHHKDGKIDTNDIHRSSVDVYVRPIKKGLIGHGEIGVEGSRMES